MSNTKLTNGTNTKMESDYKISTFNNGELFAITDDYTIYGCYYKSRKAAEKKLLKVRTQAGEIN